MTPSTSFQQTQQQTTEDGLRFTSPTSTTEAVTENLISSGDEHEPLLAHMPETELQHNGNADDEANSSPTSSQSSALFYNFLRCGTQILHACLALACVSLGFYVLYILIHLPTLVSLLREGNVELEAASLVDTSDDSVLLSALLRFPGRISNSVMFPFANVTIFHEGDTVGWLCARNIEISSPSKALELSEIFHIVDQNAMGRVLSETGNSRRISVDTKAVVDLSGVGRFLPTLTMRRKMSFTLPALPTVGYTIHDIEGPVVKDDGIATHALLRLSIPYNISANIDRFCLDVCFANVTLANACIGPTTIDTNGHCTIPVNVHIPTISGPAHENALADILRRTGAGNWPEFVVTGSDPSKYTDAPIWLRRALSDMSIPIRMTPPHIPRRHLPPLNDLVADTTVGEFYAYWSASKSYHPWVGLSARTTLSLPNPTGSDLFVEVQSLVPNNIRLIDNELGPFAVATTNNFSFSTKQLTPLCFDVALSCDCLGVDVIPGMEQTFIQTMRRYVTSESVSATVNGTLDVVFQTSIGRLHVESMPFSVGMNGWIGWENIDAISLPLPAFRHDYAVSPVGFPKPTISNIHISDTTQDRISLELVFEVKNPFRYGAYMSDIAFMLRYSGLHIATVSLREPALNRGQNTVTSFVDFYNHASDPRQQAFFLQASSGRNLTIEIAGFPNCTSITPLEASLRDFSREIVVDTSKFKSGDDSASSGVQSVLREVVLHAFDMSAEATMVNPVSGADIWLQSIEAIGYYDGGISLGSMDYDFTLDQGLLVRSRNSSAIVATRYPSNGLLLPPKTATTTPRMPVTANKTSIGWDVVRRAIGGTLDVDVFTSVQLLVGSAYLNLTVMGKNAPVKIRL